MTRSDYAKRRRQTPREIEIERRAREAQAIFDATGMTVWPDNVGLATPDERQARKEV